MGIAEDLLAAARSAPTLFRGQRTYLLCHHCKQTKHRDEFYDGIKGRKDSWCKECKKQYNREVIANRSRKARLKERKHERVDQR